MKICLQDEVSSIENGLFMMETSGRGTLNSRQACAVESAAMRSGLTVHMVMFSSLLDLRDNTTCQIYMSNNNIRFYTIDVESFSADTPLGRKPSFWYQNQINLVLEFFFSSARLASSLYSAVHTADALRLLILYKYGGFYLDLDYVVFNDLSHYNNIVVANKP